MQLDTKDLKRKLSQTYLAKENYDRRRKAISPTAVQLKFEDDELKDLEVLAKEEEKRLGAPKNSKTSF